MDYNEIGIVGHILYSNFICIFKSICIYATDTLIGEEVPYRPNSDTIFGIIGMIYCSTKGSNTLYIVYNRCKHCRSFGRKLMDRKMQI